MSKKDPKAAIGIKKPSTFAIPPSAIIQLGEAMRTGAEKYGTFNWRGTKIKSSVYYDAIMRHLMEWRDGEVADSESGLHPLAHVMANCAILIDAKDTDMLFDNRGVSGRVGRMIRELSR